MSQIILTRPTSVQVRAWAVAQNLAAPGRGRLSAHAIAEYNRAHGLWGARAYVRDEPVRRHSVKPARGRTIVRSYRVSDARAWAVAQGLCAPGTRGRMSVSVLDAFVLAGAR